MYRVSFYNRHGFALGNNESLMSIEETKLFIEGMEIIRLIELGDGKLIVDYSLYGVQLTALFA